MNKIEISVTYVSTLQKKSEVTVPCCERCEKLLVLSEKLTWISERERLIGVEGYNFLTPTREQQQACHSLGNENHSA